MPVPIAAGDPEAIHHGELDAEPALHDGSGSIDDESAREDATPRLRRDAAQDIIRDAILVGESGFRSGDILSENIVAERLGLTKNPVRQALTQLAAEGLLVIIPRVGTQVRVIRPEEAQAILALRIAIETIIVGELARTKPDLAPLWKIHRQMEQLRNQKSSREQKTLYEFVKLDMAFHSKMAELLDGYGMALKTLNDLSAQFFLYALRAIHAADAPSVMQTVLGEHARMLKAIGEGDRKEALQSLHDHIRASTKRLTPFATPYLESNLPHYIRYQKAN
jgi:DNA-binding GntR family transcriptional regulator